MSPALLSLRTIFSLRNNSFMIRVYTSRWGNLSHVCLFLFLDWENILSEASWVYSDQSVFVGFCIACKVSWQFSTLMTFRPIKSTRLNSFRILYMISKQLKNFTHMERSIDCFFTRIVHAQHSIERCQIIYIGNPFNSVNTQCS